jgi:hypothetical protein
VPGVIIDFALMLLFPLLLAQAGAKLPGLQSSRVTMLQAMQALCSSRCVQSRW